jgi:hypothetical protein
MAQHNRFSHNKKQKARGGNAPHVRSPIVLERRVPVVYGKAVIVMEDEQKNTFVFKGGNWIPHEMSIADCRKECEVKVLPQKVNRMTRYEVRFPVAMES